MVKKILFIASLLTVGLASGQTFQFNDHNDVDITNTTHYEYGNGAILSSIKFHIENTSGISADYTADVQEISNSTVKDLQVCYGLDCFVGTAGVSTVQQIGAFSTVASGGVDETFKVAPFAFSWVQGDSAVWEVVVRNTTDPTDVASSTIVWKFRIIGDVNEDGVIGVGEVAGDIDGNGVIDGSEIAGDVTGDGAIGDEEKVGDVDGNGAIDGSEFWGDINGNGVIDGGEIALSVNEINGDDVDLSAYPNPASDNLTVKYEVKGGADGVVLSVYDVLGQEILLRNLSENKGEVNLNLKTVDSGIYFYAIKVAGKTVKTERFIVR